MEVESEQEFEHKIFHMRHGHLGINSTLRTVTIIRKIDKTSNQERIDHKKSCHYCQVGEEGDPVKYGLLNGKLAKEEPLVHLSTDVFGAFDESNFGHGFESTKLYLFTITDRSTRLTKVRFTDKINYTNFLECSKEEWIDLYGAPKTFLCDQGTYYESKEVRSFSKAININLIGVSPYNPTGNGITEELKNTVGQVIRKYTGWDLVVLKVVLENRLKSG